MINIVNKGARIADGWPALVAKYKFWSSYIGMQHQKKPDMSRACIKLMMSPQVIETSIEYLVNSHQFGVTQANKFFNYIIREDFNVGDVLRCIVAGDMVQLDINDGFEKFKTIIRKIMACPNNKLQTINLHNDNGLDNFLKIAEHLQTITPFKFNRVLLSILCNYATHFEQITDYDLYKITRHLTERSYVSDKILRHFQQLVFDQAKTQRLFQEGTQEQIKIRFETFAYMLDTVVNLQYHGHKSKLNPQLKQKLMQTFFSFLENPENSEITCGLNPHCIFIDKIFSQNKDRYLKIIENIINPATYTTVRMKPNLFQVIFDKLFKYTEFGDKQQVERLLEKYCDCLGSMAQHDNQPKISGGTVIMLCEKFGYYSEQLFQHLLNFYILTNLKLKPINYPLGLRKNSVAFLHHLAFRIYEIGVMLRLAPGKNSELENQLIEAFNYNTQKMLSKRGSDNFSLQAIFLSHNYEQYKKLKPPPRDEFKPSNLFSRYEQYFLTEQTIAPFMNFVNKVQHQNSVTWKELTLEDNAFPLILKLNTGARLKVLIWVALFARKFGKNNYFFSYFNRFIDKSEVVQKLLEENITYPGLIQGYVLLNCLPNEFVLKYSSQAGQKHRFLETYIENVNKLLQKQEKIMKKIKESEELDVKFLNNIQFLAEPLRVRPSYYKNNPELQITMFFKYEIGSYLKKYQKLIKKLSEQLKLAKSRNNLQNIYAFSPYSEFPYATGFSVLKDKKKYFILFIEEGEKERYEQLLKFIKDKKQGKITETKKFQPITMRELSISYYSERNTVVLISNEEDVKKFIISFY